MAALTLVDREEALRYWCGSANSVFKRNRLPNDRLDRLLRGIAACIASNFGQQDHNDLTPSQLAAFYRTVGGNYDPLLQDMPPQSIAFIYKSLGCVHSLQPNPSEDGYSHPSIPALKPKGFVTWQTIQLLLGPEEHVPFIQSALRKFEVLDPEDGTPFPKLLPREAFPSTPDEHMVAWHQGVSERLRLEAQAQAEQSSDTSRRSSTDASTDGGNERAHAVQYFSNPFYRNRDGRPAIVRHISRAPGLAWKGGQMVVRTVRTLADPAFGQRRRSHPERTNSGDVDESDGPTPLAVAPAARPNGQQQQLQQYQYQIQHQPAPQYRQRHSDTQRPQMNSRPDISRHDSKHSPPRGRSTQSRAHSESDSDTEDSHDEPSPPRRHHAVQRPRSHESPRSPQPYWEQHQQHQLYQQQQQELPHQKQHHKHTPSTSLLPRHAATPIGFLSAANAINNNPHPDTQNLSFPSFRPSQSPPFAAKITNSQLRQPGYFDQQRPSAASTSIAHPSSSYELRSPADQRGRSRGDADSPGGESRDDRAQDWNSYSMVQAQEGAQDGEGGKSGGRMMRYEGAGDKSGKAVVGVHGRRYVNETPWR